MDADNRNKGVEDRIGLMLGRLVAGMKETVLV